MERLLQTLIQKKAFVMIRMGMSCPLIEHQKDRLIVLHMFILMVDFYRYVLQD